VKLWKIWRFPERAGIIDVGTKPSGGVCQELFEGKEDAEGVPPDRKDRLASAHPKKSCP
jgi:hypothetical protein